MDGKVVCLWFLHFCLLAASQEDGRCGGCDVSEPSFVIGRERVCSVQNTTNLLGETRVKLTWYDAGCSEVDHCDEEICPTYIGMTLTFACPNGAEVHKIRAGDDQRVWRNSSVLIDSVQVEDAGLYMCVMNNGDTLAYNVTVSTAPVIGMQYFYCELEFTFNEDLECCENTNSVPLDKGQFKVPRTFHALGTTNVTVQQSWISPPEEHYPIDLGLALKNTSHHDFIITLQHVPKIVNEQQHNVRAIITAANNFSSNAVCIHLQFAFPQEFIAIVNFPLDATKGANATFECELGAVHSVIGNGLYSFQYNLTINGTSVVVWSAYCPLRPAPLYCQEEYNNSDISLRFSNISIYPLNIQYNFTFEVINVTDVHNQSSFSCSIESEGQIQWQRTAKLNVNRNLLEMATDATDIINQTITSVYVVLCLVCVIATVVAVISFLAVRRVKASRRRQRRKRPEQVPLTDHMGCDSEVNTPVSPNPVNFAGASIPTVQIVEDGPGINETEVNNPLPNQDGGDPGYQSSQSCEDVSNAHKNLYTSIISYHPAANTLGSIRSQVSKSDTDLYITSGRELGNATGSMWHGGKCVVYVSYTERMANWVRIVLKPLIESWQHSEVVLHEEDMIPGFTVSGERQRLILQAHKVVLVVSRDYSESPWCLYELHHAIQQEPDMCQGRVIPILVDGCQHLPSIVAGVVPLVENDRNFNTKLRKNIMGY